jgi:hypothetical protein
MRSRLLSAAAAALLVPVMAAAQTRGQPNVVLTIYAGVGSGYSLWAVDRQTLTYGGSTANQPDTVDLTRHVGAGLALGALFQLYRTQRTGIVLDASFATLGFDDTCSPAAPFQTDAQNRNATLCDNISAAGSGGTMLGLTLGGAFRFVPGATVSPYVRLSAGASLLSASTLEMAAPETLAGLPRVVISDPSPSRTTLNLVGAAGITTPLGTGYQFRLELRDRMVTLERLSGPANALGIGPTDTRLAHRIELALGLDIVLEQKRGRSY